MPSGAFRFCVCGSADLSATVSVATKRMLFYMRGVVPLLICGLTLVVSFYGVMIVMTRWISHGGHNAAQADIGLAMLATPISLVITIAVGIVVFRYSGPRE